MSAFANKVYGHDRANLEAQLEDRYPGITGEMLESIKLGRPVGHRIVRIERDYGDPCNTEYEITLEVGGMVATAHVSIGSRRHGVRVNSVEIQESTPSSQPAKRLRNSQKPRSSRMNRISDPYELTNYLEAQLPGIGDDLCESLLADEPRGRVEYIDVRERDRLGDNIVAEAIVCVTGTPFAQYGVEAVKVRFESGSNMGFVVRSITDYAWAAPEEPTCVLDNPLRGSW